MFFKVTLLIRVNNMWCNIVIYGVDIIFLSNDLSFFFERFEMGDGFVLDFTNATFRNFVLESVGIDVYDKNYLKNVEQIQNSSSKANILRYFWRNESSSFVFKLTNDLVEYYGLLYYDYDDSLLDKAKKIIF